MLYRYRSSRRPWIRICSAAFVQDGIMLRPDVFFTAGTQLEHNDYTGYEAEPSVRFQWSPSSTQTLWSAVSRAVRTPSGGYTLLKEDLRVEAGRTDSNDGLNETADPQQQASLRSAVDLGRNLDLSTALRWVDTLHINNAAVVGIVPSYFELNTRLGWHPTARIELSIVGENLLHAQHAEYGSPSPSRIEIRRSLFGRIPCQF
jgi:outer membrane receptor protein involved in Fe transport